MATGRLLLSASIERRMSGVTLVESLLAVLILSAAVLGVMLTLGAGRQHLDRSEERTRAVRLAEHLLEEVCARSYDEAGTGRATWSVAQFDGYQESAGQITDCAGRLYPASDQRFGRSVQVQEQLETVTGLGGVQLSGRRVTVVVGVDDQEWSLARFIPEPAAP